MYERRQKRSFLYISLRLPTANVVLKPSISAMFDDNLRGMKADGAHAALRGPNRPPAAAPPAPTAPPPPPASSAQQNSLKDTA